MKKFLLLFVIFLFGGIYTAHACTSDQIDVNGDGSICENTKFSITTTNLSAGTQFKFFMSATGTFYIDCGTDGILSSAADPTDVSGKTITRTNTIETLYICTYDTAGAKTIRFGGVATGYSTVASGSNDNDFTAVVPAVRFGHNDATPGLISSISGSLGQIFPTLGQSNGRQPRFFSTFKNCTNLTSIPSSLFSGVNGGTSYMFFYTFYNCNKLISIPEYLFQNINQCGYKLFSDTFRYCKSLTSIPENLFDGIGCYSNDLFIRTFMGCISLTSIPENLFKNIRHAHAYTFCQTFKYCDALTNIPGGLFKNITSVNSKAFMQTFAGCISLTSIPDGLFANIRSGAINVFENTFSGCTNLSGYIPPSMFAGLIENNATYQTDMMIGIFNNTNLDTLCPSGTVRYTTPYDSYWSSKVSCVDENLTCDSGEYLRAHGYQCISCPNGYTCAGGTYPYSENTDQGLVGNTITINWYGALQSDINANNAGTVIYGGDIRTPVRPDPSQIPIGKRFKGWRFSKPSQN